MIPFRQVIEWYDFTKKKPGKRDGFCIFSDGVIHRVGWWSVSDQELMIPNSDGTNGVIDHDEITIWARLPNIVADADDFFNRGLRAKGQSS